MTMPKEWSRFEFKTDPENGYLVGPDGCHYRTEQQAFHYARRNPPLKEQSMAIPLDAYGEDNQPYRLSKSKTELQAMTNAELADYIESGTFDDDGFSHSARVGLVRVLRHLAIPD